jgi:hypothetical protein
MKAYLNLINKKDGHTRERVDISHYFERYLPSKNRELNNLFLDCWLADRTKELKRKYFPRKQGYLMIYGVDDNGRSIGCSKIRIDSVVVNGLTF